MDVDAPDPNADADSVSSVWSCDFGQRLINEKFDGQFFQDTTTNPNRTIFFGSAGAENLDKLLTEGFGLEGVTENPLFEIDNVTSTPSVSNSQLIFSNGFDYDHFYFVFVDSLAVGACSTR